jgi:hypothetical protein
MPAFSFEKLAPPVNHEPVAVAAVKQPRGIIVQMLDRLTEARLRRVDKEISKGQSQDARTRRD